MKKILISLLLILLLATPCFSQVMGPKVYVYQSTDCSFLTWYGALCQDTDDGKLYKWNGATQVELAAGGGGDVTAASTTQTWGGGTTLGWTFSVTGTDPTITATDSTISIGGSLGATATRVTKGWFSALETTAYPTVNGAAVFDQDVSADGNPSFSTINVVGTNSLNVGTASSLTGQIVFKNAGGANTATLQSGTTSGSYTLNLPLAAVAIGDVIVGSAANQLGVVAKGAAVAGVLGWDAAGTLGKYTTMSFDNTAAQFYDSPAPTKLVKIDPVGVTAGKTATLAFSNTDNATFTFPAVTASLAPLVSPAFTTPALGTPSAVVLTNATGFPASPPGIVERLGATFDGGGAAIAVNKVAYTHVPFAVTAINSWVVQCHEDSGVTGIIMTPYLDAYAEDTHPTTTMCTTGSAPHTTDGAGAGGKVHKANWDCNITAIPADSMIMWKVTTAPTDSTWCSVTLKVTR